MLKNFESYSRTLELAKELWNLLKKNMLKNFGSCSRTLELVKELWNLLKSFRSATLLGVRWELLQLTKKIS
jgi:hypothetical protein